MGKQRLMNNKKTVVLSIFKKIEDKKTEAEPKGH